MGRLIRWLGKSVVTTGLGLLVLALAAALPILWLLEAMPEAAIAVIFGVIGFVAGRATGFAAATALLGLGIVFLALLAAGNWFGLAILIGTFWAIVGALVGATWRRIRDRPAPLRTFTMEDEER